MSVDNPMHETEADPSIQAQDLTLDGLGAAADPTLAPQAPMDHVQASLDAGFAGTADFVAYDGHVALALDSSTLPGLDATLDLLTTAHDLFDVPAMDFGGGGGADDASIT